MALTDMAEIRDYQLRWELLALQIRYTQVFPAPEPYKLIDPS